MAEVCYGVRGLQIRLSANSERIWEAVSLTGFESVSELFHFQLELRGEVSPTATASTLVGKPIVAIAELSTGPKRYFNGIIASITEMNRDERFVYLIADVRPALWLLTKTKRSRIFQDKTTPEILREVLAGLDVRFNVNEEMRPHSYCVQYGESDFAFASRLLEEEGLHYYFQHSETGHTMVICCARGPGTLLGTDAEIRFNRTAGGQRLAARVFQWRVRQEVAAHEFIVRDHSFQMTGADIEARRLVAAGANGNGSTQRTMAGSSLDLVVFHYPGGYAHRYDGVGATGEDQAETLALVHQHGQRMARIAAERETAACMHVEGKGDSIHFGAGQLFHLREAGSADGEYRLLRVEHSLHFEVRRLDSEGWEYENHFHCLPARAPYRPVLKTPRPIIAGAQSAMVVGCGGDEILVDKYGRIRVRFPWDCSPVESNSGSCWLRIAQSWAGQGWGAHFIPRAGQEVFVGFLEGDPDQPIVMGSVYNSKQTPPFQLPAEKTKSGLRSRSNHGDSQNYSELSFDDAAGAELMKLHAERNMKIAIENDLATYIAGNRTTYVGYGVVPSDDDDPSDGDDPSDSTGGRGKNKSGASSNGGNSFDRFFSNATNTYWQYCGAYECLFVGTYDDVTIGEYTSINLAANVYFQLAAVFSIAIARSYSLTAGPKLELDYTTAKIVETNQTTTAAGMILLTAGAEIGCIAGGAVDIEAGADITLFTPLICTVKSSSFVLSSTAIVVTGASVNVLGASIALDGAVEVTGGLTIEGDLTVAGQLNVVGNVSILGALTVNGLQPMYV